MSFLPFSDEQLQELDTRFGGIAVVRAETPPQKRWSKAAPEPPYEVVFRTPMQAESDAFEGAANNERERSGALRSLAQKTIVGVSLDGKIVIHNGERHDRAAAKDARAAWEALRQRYPGAHIAASSQLQQLMGSVAEEQGKE